MLKFNIDAAGIAEQFGELKVEIEQDIVKAVGALAATTHAMVLQKAQQELHSTRETYVNALKFEEVAEGVWIVSLEQEAMFIEEGLPENFDMKPGLLKNAKVSAKGTRYKVIPFDHGQAPSGMTVRAQTVVDNIKQGLKKADIPFKKIETNLEGSPRVGKIHADLKLGGPVLGKGNTPVGDNVNIYQSKTKTGNIRRDITTFRTVTDGPGSADKWIHPGLEAKKFMDKALEEAMAIWENQVLPEILAKWKK